MIVAFMKFAAVMIPIAAALVGLFVLFRRGRRPTCTWARPCRVLAQAPGWLLAGWGAVSVVLLARMEIREKRVGLGTGTLVAVITATIKGIAMAYGRRSR